MDAIIDFLEKKFKLDIGYYLKGGFWLSLSNVVNVSKLLIIGIIFARFLSKETFGAFTYINSIFLLTNVFGAPGMSTAIVQSVARGYEGTLAYLTKKVFLWSLMGSLFLSLFGFYEKFFASGENFGLFIILGLLFPFYSIGLNFTYYLIAVKKFHLRMLMELGQNVAIIFSIIIILFLRQGLLWLILIPILVQIITNLFYLGYLIRSANDKIDYSSNKFGKVLNLANFLPTAKMQADKILVTNFLGFANTAVYNIAAAISDQVYALAKIITAMVVPKSANMTQEILQKSFKKIFYYPIALFGLISIFLFFIYPYLIPFVFGKQYAESVFYAQIITLFVSMKSIAAILQQINQSKKELKSTMFSAYVSPLLELGLMLIFIVKYQILGIIIGKAIADFLNLAVVIYYFNKKSKINSETSSE